MAGDDTSAAWTCMGKKGNAGAEGRSRGWHIGSYAITNMLEHQLSKLERQPVGQRQGTGAVAPVLSGAAHVNKYFER